MKLIVLSVLASVALAKSYNVIDPNASSADNSNAGYGLVPLQASTQIVDPAITTPTPTPGYNDEKPTVVREPDLLTPTPTKLPNYYAYDDCEENLEENLVASTVDSNPISSPTETAADHNYGYNASPNNSDSSSFQDTYVNNAQSAVVSIISLAFCFVAFL